ncbi:MAG: hypothetical protein U0797_13210 [Gemmataceae bacterium]
MVGFYLLGVAVGLLMIAVAVFNWESWFFDAESRLIEVGGGENAVRWYWGLAGLGVIAWSIASWARSA